MEERIYRTEKGDIHYYVNIIDPQRVTLVFLPGLSADHRLFEKQLAYFEGRENVFVWDAPGHAKSRPFTLDFELVDKARWLHNILETEGICRPVLIGQSMGGYLSQAFVELYPGISEGMIVIDSAPLQRKYVSSFDLFFMEHAEGLYRLYPWKTLLKAGSEGVAETEYGRNNMREMMMDYNENPRYYCKLVGHGYKMLAHAIKSNLPYEITCKAILICGEEDKAGVTRKYNKKWQRGTGLPMEWIANAGHNSNADQPDRINEIIKSFLK